MIHTRDRLKIDQDEYNHIDHPNSTISDTETNSNFAFPFAAHHVFVSRIVVAISTEI